MNMQLSLNTVFRLTCLALVMALPACTNDPQSAAQAVVTDTAIKLDVYKSPTCGCCQDWVDHAESDGFKTLVHHASDLGAVKQQYDISPANQSCHTAVTEQGYVFEGHVPAQLVKQFLANPPQGALGLAVPGMPFGSPGMEMGDRVDQYSVLLLYPNGRTEHFAEVAGVTVIDN